MMSNTLFFVLLLSICSNAEPIYKHSRRGYSEIEKKSVQESLEHKKTTEDSEAILKKEIDYYKNQRLFFYNDDNELVEAFLEEDYKENVGATRKSIDSRVEFNLYTRANPSEPQILRIGDIKSLKGSNFDLKRETRFIAHGWVNSKKSPACTLIRDGYLGNDEYNVIVVDWGSITFRPYSWAARRVRMVGEHVASMIDFLEEQGMNLNTTTLVGHSLGAHVVGLGGYYAKGKVKSIFGLDPALPLFVFSGPGSRISANDALHVEIIHTNAGVLGVVDAIGHADFYPNGGRKQHGCIVDLGGACSHARSFQFFAESINSPVGFYGKKCENYLEFRLGRCKSQNTATMGGLKNEWALPGTYYLKTKGKSPFAKGINVSVDI